MQKARGKFLAHHFAKSLFFREKYELPVKAGLKQGQELEHSAFAPGVQRQKRFIQDQQAHARTGPGRQNQTRGQIKRVASPGGTRVERAQFPPRVFQKSIF